MQRTSTIHQHIQPPKSLYGSFHCALDIPSARHIALHCESRAAFLLDFARHLSNLF
jgi:hypothetical protein